MTSLIQPFDPARHTEYLRDESLRSGKADTISFPSTKSQIRQVLTQVSDRQIPVTVQGSRTGIDGRAVPHTGHILNLSAMNRITDMTLDSAGNYRLKVQPGVILADLVRQTASRRFDNAGQWGRSSLAVLERFQKDPSPWFWPPDPTEDTATIGGMAATNARGICVHAYERARQHIRAVQGVNIRETFHKLNLKQSQDAFLSGDNGLGIITELTLQLMPMPPQMWGMVFFFPCPDQAPEFIDRLKSDPVSSGDFGRTIMAAMELMDSKTLEIIHRFKKAHPVFRSMPAVDPTAAGAVYLELHGSSEPAMTDLAAQLMDAAEQAGGDADASFAATSHGDLSRIRLFRKAAPHAVSHVTAGVRQKDDRIYRLGYDLIRPDMSVSEQVQNLETDMADTGVSGIIFGHAANSCLHVNLVPENHDEFIRAKTVIRHWADQEKSGTNPNSNPA